MLSPHLHPRHLMITQFISDHTTLSCQSRRPPRSLFLPLASLSTFHITSLHITSAYLTSPHLHHSQHHLLSLSLTLPFLPSCHIASCYLCAFPLLFSSFLSSPHVTSPLLTCHHINCHFITFFHFSCTNAPHLHLLSPSLFSLCLIFLYLTSHHLPHPSSDLLNPCQYKINKRIERM